MFCDYGGIKLEIKESIWKKKFLNNSGIRKITLEIKKYLNWVVKNTAYQNLWDTAKAVHRETFEAFSVNVLEKKKTFKSISKS